MRGVGPKTGKPSGEHLWGKAVGGEAGTQGVQRKRVSRVGEGRAGRAAGGCGRGAIANRMGSLRDTAEGPGTLPHSIQKWGWGVKEVEEEGHGEDAGPRTQVRTARRTRATARSRNTTSSNRDKDTVTE